ncbi:MAG: acyltransferase [Williamsia sp.]|nr:acyltransferase [Williamsia sp.]
MNNQAGQAIPGTARLFGLDHLRTLAIGLVFLYHYGHLFPHPAWTATIGKFGWTGVDLFFVLSGYLIASQLFASVAKTAGFSFRQFFLKRFFRIVPPYWVVVAIYFCFPFVHEREALAPLWKYATFTQNLGLDLRTQGTFSHAWSLCIEEQFYLLLPLILLALIYCKVLKKSGWLLPALFLAGFAIRIYCYQTFVAPHLEDDEVWAIWYKWIYYLTACRLDGLLAGVSIAALVQFRPFSYQRIAKWGNGLFVLSLLVLTGAYYICSEEESFGASVFGFPLVSIGYGLMVLSAISPTSFLYKSKLPVTSTLALLSYAIYLIHKIVIHVAQDQLAKVGIAKNSNRMFLLCVAISVAGALLMNKVVEKSFLKLRDRILRKKPSGNNQLYTTGAKGAPGALYTSDKP